MHEYLEDFPDTSRLADPQLIGTWERLLAVRESVNAALEDKRKQKLIGNSLGDPATPYEDAVSTESVLADARLLTLETYGHTAQGGSSQCIDEAVDRYLIRLRLPPPGLVCEPDLGPFDPIPEEPAPPLEEPVAPAPVVPAG